MEKLVVVSSVTVEECFEQRLKKSLSKIGVSYTLILTDPNLTVSKSFNSIVNHRHIEYSTYILFVSQDIEFVEENWGKKLFDWCNSLMPDLGCAGVECNITETCYENYFRVPATWRKVPIQVVTCDPEIIIIPTEIFLKHQFDEQFDWLFPMAEDYALWTSLINHKKVFSLPLRITGGCEGRLSKWNSQFEGKREAYLDAIHDRYMKLYEKWGKLFPNGKMNISGVEIPMDHIPNTSWNRSQERNYQERHKK